jgi:HK97 family phage major capsid protein
MRLSTSRNLPARASAALNPPLPASFRMPHRFVTAAPVSMRADGDRAIEHVFSDSSVALDGHTVATSGWILDDYLRNPVYLWAHDAESPPIGRVTQIGAVGDQLRATVLYADEGQYPFADTIFRLTKAGFINASSVSWVPVEWRYAADKSRPGGIDFLRQKLLEASAVPVPALASALVSARAAGIDTSPMFEWATRELDLGHAPLKRKELEMVRTLAAPAPPTIYYRETRNSVVRSKSRDDPALFDVRARGGGFEIVGGQILGRQIWSGGLGEFLNAVARAGAGARPDPRLKIRAPTGAGVVDPTSGGFLVPDEFSDSLINSLYSEAVIAPRCDRRTSSKPNNASIPAIDEISRADGSRFGGVCAYWEAEGIEPPSSLPKFRGLKLSASKLIALCIATEELINDVPLLGTNLTVAFGGEMSFKLDESILAGTGAGTPLGIVNAPGTIVVPADVGQTRGITSSNISNIWSRLPAPCRRRAVWLINEDAEQELDNLGPAATASSFAVYMPRGVNGNPTPLLKGRECIVCEQSAPLGNLGDIVLADLSQYIIVDGGASLGLVSRLRVDIVPGMLPLYLQVLWRSCLEFSHHTVQRRPNKKPLRGVGRPLDFIFHLAGALWRARRRRPEAAVEPAAVLHPAAGSSCEVIGSADAGRPDHFAVRGRAARLGARARAIRPRETSSSRSRQRPRFLLLALALDAANRAPAPVDIG